jgi:hypothetical protein
VRSYLCPAAEHGVGFLDALVMLAAGEPWMPARDLALGPLVMRATLSLRRCAGRQLIEQVLESTPGERSGSGWILGSGDHEAELDERRQQAACPVLDQLGVQAAFVGLVLDRSSEQPVAVTGLDGAPSLPAQGARCVDERYLPDNGIEGEVQIYKTAGAQRVGYRPSSRRCPPDGLRNLGLDLLEHGGKEILLVLEVVVEGAAADACRLEHLLNRGLVIAALREQLASRIEETAPGQAAPFAGVGHLSDCTYRPTVWYHTD